jgi:uncharacterized protein (DUF952 family)
MRKSDRQSNWLSDQQGWYREIKLSSLWGESLLLKMDVTLHLVPKAYFESLDPRQDYTPSDFARDGFIHCTDSPEEMAHVANALYKSNLDPHYYLYIDKTSVRASVRYDDAGRKYPHIYGALNRDAIVAVREARRDAQGSFLTPEIL